MGFFDGKTKLDEMTSTQLQNYAMKYARENNMSESAAIKLFGSKIKQKQAEEAKGEENKMSKGGKPTKKVPVISIGVGMTEMPKNKTKKTAMMRGGMANGKQHMYAAGGVVNDGLKALAKTRPDVVAKILK